jgi:UDP-N-acetylmuramate dehydrogenase
VNRVFELAADLARYTTLRAGGKADRLAVARTADELVDTYLAEESGTVTILGHGSNVLPSDAGVRGLVLVNAATEIRISADGAVTADAGCCLQDVFLKTAQASLSGLEFCVGIPGTLGGALVSNAGAYRSNIGDLVTALEIVYEGTRRWVEPAWIEFSYRDSKLRKPNPPACALVRARLQLCPGEGRGNYEKAREIQRQRISKQPPQASAGSFFKNVNDAALAVSLPNLPESLKKAGVVPAGYLLEAAGMKGFVLGGARFSERHANFIVNVGGATATDIRRLACRAKQAVAERFGVALSEEVLYVGDWSGFVEGV